jgi:hypothetical protein
MDMFAADRGLRKIQQGGPSWMDPLWIKDGQIPESWDVLCVTSSHEQGWE